MNAISASSSMCKTGFTGTFIGLLVESFELVDLSLSVAALLKVLRLFT